MKDQQLEILLSVINEEGKDQFFAHAKTEFLDLAFKALICSDDFAEMDPSRKKAIYNYYETLGIVVESLGYYVNNTEEVAEVA